MIDDAREYKTSDMSTAAYVAMQGYKIVRLEPYSFHSDRLIFVIDCPIEKGNDLQDEFLQSDFFTYFEVLKQTKTLLHNFKDRQRLDSP